MLLVDQTSAAGSRPRPGCGFPPRPLASASAGGKRYGAESQTSTRVASYRMHPAELGLNRFSKDENV